MSANDEMLDVLQITIGAIIEALADSWVTGPKLENAFCPVPTEGRSLHVAHFKMKLATDKYCAFGWRRLVLVNPDSRLDSKNWPCGGFGFSGRKEKPHLNALADRIRDAVDVFEDLVAKLLRDSEKTSLAWMDVDSRKVCVSQHNGHTSGWQQPTTTGLQVR